MTQYCEICGEELDPSEEEEGICENCKVTRNEKKPDEDEDYVDPGIT